MNKSIKKLAQSKANKAMPTRDPASNTKSRMASQTKSTRIPGGALGNPAKVPYYRVNESGKQDLIGNSVRADDPFAIRSDRMDPNFELQKVVVGTNGLRQGVMRRRRG